MNIQTLCLSILYEQDVTGYEIRKLSTQGNYSYFVEASYGSIYPALNKLEEGGFVTSRHEAHSGLPTKRIFSITDAGRSKFHNSLFDELGEDVFRSEFLLFARFASLLPVALVKQRLNERLATLEKKRSGLKAMLVAPLQKSDVWVLNYGVEIIAVEIEYIKTHMGQLMALAVQEDAQTKRTDNRELNL